MNEEQIERLRVIAAETWGLLTSKQAATAGITRLQLSRLANQGQLVHIAHGIYRVVGDPEPPHLNTLVAWIMLAAGEANNLVVAGVAAAAWHGLTDSVPEVVDLIVPIRKTTRRDGVRLRIRTLTVDEIRIHDELPVLSVERTIADLIELWAESDLLAEAYRRARAIPTFDLESLDRYLAPFTSIHNVPGSGGVGLRAKLLDPALSSTRKAEPRMTNTQTAPTREDIDDVLQRVAMTALGYYPQIHIDEPEYLLGDEVRWCLEPLGTLPPDDGATLEHLVGETIIDPTAHREQMFGELLSLLPE